jgi:REP element-mobilizing transposase RayT
MYLLDPRFKKLFLSFVEKAKRKFHFRLRDFCIMGNHIHLSIKTGKDGNLSEIMQWINLISPRRGTRRMDGRVMCGENGSIPG